jgi:hypothetical protein
MCAGYDPLKDTGSRHGKVTRRYIVRMKQEVQDLDSAISR